jgi:alkanesulfonate monooxygenase SsuD/methylene tetrahydromethanopterin reductase-like flavin-dependent oxidoreductase (luciferase family)
MFVEYSEMLLQALETGVAEYDGVHLKQPRVELRPRPFKSFKGRTYCGAVSPESMEIMAKLGVGMLITPSKPWDVVGREMVEYQTHFRKYHGEEPVPTIAVGWVFCDEDEGRAKELGAKYIKDYWMTVLGHYGFNKPENFKGKKGYEFYAKGAELQQKMKEEEIANAFLDFHVYGTPAQCYEKIMDIRSHVGCLRFNGVFRYAGMPYPEAERNLRLFAETVVPRLRKVPDPTVFTTDVDKVGFDSAG